MNRIAICFLAIAAHSAALAETDTAKDIFHSAKLFASFATYSADVEDLKPPGAGKYNVKVSSKIFCQTSNDGTSKTRTETTTRVVGEKPRNQQPLPVRTTITIVDNDTWLLFPDEKRALCLKLIHSAEAAVVKNAAESAPLKSDFFDEFSLSESVVDGKPCYKVTASASPESIEFQKGVWKKERSKQSSVTKQLDIPPSILSKRVTYIGKDDRMFYREDNFDVSGNLTSSRRYSNISVNVPLSDDLFSIPPDYAKTSVSTVEEYKSALLDLITSKRRR